MASATLIRLNKDEWQKLPAGHFYNGKYQVGPFTITYEFIVKYMALIHKTEIPESWLTDNGTSLDERRVLYMEASDIRKRAARTVLTGMCYSVGSATRQGSSS
ncbi:hypothetical protein PO345_05775, partial [Klebsiella pneumoniae]